jgi:repressor LexA
MKPLTKRQKEILDFISQHICEHGYAPTIREIGKEMGIKSTNGVSEHIETLTRKGYLIREEADHTSKKRGKRPARSIRPHNLPTISKSELAIPLVGRVTAGQPRLAVEETEDLIYFDRSLIGDARDIYALRINGESMIEKGIHDGDVVFVHRTRNASNGDIVIALLDDEATCKLFYREPEHRRVRLQPANASMEPIYVEPGKFNETMIQGVVIGLYHSF